MRAFGLGGKALGFELVGKLAELVEANARPEAERVRLGPGHAAAMGLARLAKAGADRPIDGLLERDALFACALLQESGKTIVDGKRGPHVDIIDAMQSDGKTSAACPTPTPGSASDPVLQGRIHRLAQPGRHAYRVLPIKET
jgi:hypothetical protein